MNEHPRKQHDPLAHAIASIEVSPLDARFVARVGARAKAELRAPPSRERGIVHVPPAIRVGLVPALLAIAAVLQTAAVTTTIAEVYGAAHRTSSQ